MKRCAFCDAVLEPDHYRTGGWKMTNRKYCNRECMAGAYMLRHAAAFRRPQGSIDTGPGPRTLNVRGGWTV